MSQGLISGSYSLTGMVGALLSPTLSGSTLTGLCSSSLSSRKAIQPVGSALSSTFHFYPTSTPAKFFRARCLKTFAMSARNLLTTYLHYLNPRGTANGTI